MANHLILIGYRGVGKSSIAQNLKEKTNLPLISIDEQIENQLGVSILDYIEGGHTWASFRGIEKKVLIECLGREDAIVDSGGGVVETPSNIQMLKQAGKVFYLTAPLATLIERIKISGKRPSLTSDESLEKEVAQTLVRRIPLYRQTCHEEIDTEGKSLFEVVDEIFKRYRF